MRDRQGATAVEFGLVSVPFLTLLGGIIQLGFMIWAQQNLDFSLQRTVRSLFTGQFQAANKGTGDAATLLAALKTNMCGSGTAPNAIVFDCSGVKIDVTLDQGVHARVVTIPARRTGPRGSAPTTPARRPARS